MVGHLDAILVKCDRQSCDLAPRQCERCVCNESCVTWRPVNAHVNICSHHRLTLGGDVTIMSVKNCIWEIEKRVNCKKNISKFRSSKEVTSKLIDRMPWYLNNHQSYIEKLQIKSEQMTHLTVKMEFSTKIKSSIFYGKRFYRPKYHIPRWKSVKKNISKNKIGVFSPKN